MRILRTVPRSYIRRVKSWRVRVGFALGIERWTYTGLNGLDRRLIAYIAPDRDGTFIELGANDGLQQSNTLVLERKFGWRGLLIEPVSTLAAECRRNRPTATVVSAIVSSPANRGKVLYIGDDDLRGRIGDTGVISVSTTLSDILSGSGWDAPVDLLSIDVEGHELEVLAGLDLQAHGPRFILIETACPEDVVERLASHYLSPVRLSHHDYLFERVVGR